MIIRFADHSEAVRAQEDNKMIHGTVGHQVSARRLFRRRLESRLKSRLSTARWVFFQTGTARTSNLRPFSVNVIRRARRSAGSTLILSRARRCRGLRAAVKVVRSMASTDATASIPGGSGRFRDIMSENCPFVRPSGRNASSKRRASALAARCTWRHRQESRTICVVSREGLATIDMDQLY
jgi:hypothetical protein